MDHQQQQQSSTMSSTSDSIMHQSRMICPQSAYLFKKHKCSFCDFRSTYLWVVRRHERRKHRQNSAGDQPAQVQSIDSVQSIGPVQTGTEPQPDDGVAEDGMGGENISSAIVQDQSDQSPSTNMHNSTPISHQDSEDNNNNDNNSNDIEYNNEAGPSTQPIQTTSSSPPSSAQIPLSQRSGVIISNEGSIKRSIEEKEGPFDLRLIEDFKIFCQGPSRSGKSTWVYNILKNLSQFVKKVPELIIYVFAEWQEKLDDLQNGKLVDFFIRGNEQIEQEINKITNRKSSLIVFDDQINSQTTTAYAARLFTVDARHSGKSCIWISQNLFDSGKNGTHVRSIRTNADYITLFKCPGDCLSIQTLSKHMTGGPLLYNIHQYVTSKDPYSYLMINITQSSNEKLKYTSHTFERDGVMRVYVPQMK